MITIQDVFVSAELPVEDTSFDKLIKKLDRVFGDHFGKLPFREQRSYARALCYSLDIHSSMSDAWMA